MSAVKDLFDRILELAPGERIEVPFETEKDLRSKRTMLFREKSRYEASLKGNLLRKQIFINHKIDKENNSFVLFLSTTAESVDWLKNVVVVKDDGSKEPLKLSSEREQSVEEARIQRLKAKEVENG